MVVTLAILAFLLSKIDLTVSVNAIKRSMSMWLIAAFLSNSLGLIISACKWECLLRALGISTSRWAVIQLHTIGFFANRLLPGAVGGDVVRWHLAGQQMGERLKVAATIMVERVTGVAALVVLCFVAVFIVPELATLPVLLLLVCMSIAFFCGLALVVNRRLTTVLMFRIRRRRVGRALWVLYKLHRTLRRFPRKPLLIALGYSVLFYISAGLTFFLICKAFEAEISFFEATTVQAVICLLILIPISLGGFGLTQAGDVYLLGLLSISAAHALGISIMRLLITYGYAIVGGLLFVQWKVHPRSGAARASEASQGKGSEVGQQIARVAETRKR